MNTKKKTSVSKEEERVIDEIKKDFGEGSIMRLSESPLREVEVISSGCPSLDLALGVGGFPRGRIIELFGNEGSGKTTLALEVIAEAQKAGGKAAFIDAEHALDPDYARRIGVNLDDLLLSQPDSGEDALNIVERLIRSDIFDLIAVDSVAALVPRAELEGEIGDQQIGLQARMMSQALRKLPGAILKTKTILLFLNQIRARIGAMMFGVPETTPGGKALKFAASVRIELKRIAQLKKGGEVVGNRTRAKVVKSKVAPPFRVAEFDIFYNRGVNAGQDLLAAGVKTNVIGKATSGFTFGKQKIAPTADKTIEALNTDPALFAAVFSEIKSKLYPPQESAEEISTESESEKEE